MRTKNPARIKFSELAKGSKMYYMSRSTGDYEIEEVKLQENWRQVRNLHIANAKGLFPFASIPAAAWGRSVSVQRYDIYATSREELIEAASPYIKEKISSLEKDIETCSERIKSDKKKIKKLYGTLGIESQ